MKDILYLGPTPAEETCVGVGAMDYRIRAMKEIRAYIAQLNRMYPNKPESCRFRSQRERHDFGDYYEVVVEFDDSIRESVEFAYSVEGHGPYHWDDEAKKEIGAR